MGSQALIDLIKGKTTHPAMLKTCARVVFKSEYDELIILFGENQLILSAPLASNMIQAFSIP